MNTEELQAERRKPVNHSNEILWDPRDQPRRAAADRPHEARDIFFAILGGILIIVVVVVNLG